jgi:hypothetical protein
MSPFDDGVFDRIERQIDDMTQRISADEQLTRVAEALLPLQDAWVETLARRRQYLSAVSEAWQEVLNAIEAKFGEALESTLEAAAHRLEQTREGFEERSDVLVESIAGRSEAFVDAADEVLEQHEALVKSCLDEGLPAGLQDAQASIADAVAAVGGIVERAEGVLEAAGGGAAQSAAELTRLVDAVRPVLDVVRTLS